MTLDTLTPRQREIGALVSEGLPDKTIAAQLGVSDRYVRRLIGEIAFALRFDASKNVRVLIALRFAKCAA